MYQPPPEEERPLYQVGLTHSSFVAVTLAGTADLVLVTDRKYAEPAGKLPGGTAEWKPLPPESDTRLLFERVWKRTRKGLFILETEEETARREAMDETGLRGMPRPRFVRRFLRRKGEEQWFDTLFWCPDCPPDGLGMEQRLDPDEDVKPWVIPIKWLPDIWSLLHGRARQYLVNLPLSCRSTLRRLYEHDLAERQARHR